MNERDRFPASPSADEPMGGLTGATGSLTPDDPDDEFVPAETRELTDAGAARDITAAAHRRRQAWTAEAQDDPGRLRARDERTPPIDRDGGHGSELGGDEARAPEDEHL